MQQIKQIVGGSTETTTTQATLNSSASSASVPVAAVAGAVAAGLVLILLVMILLIVRRRRQKQREAEYQRKMRESAALNVFSLQEHPSANPVFDNEQDPTMVVTEHNPLFDFYNKDAKASEYAAPGSLEARGFMNNVEGGELAEGEWNPDDGHTQVGKFEPEKEGQYIDVNGQKVPLGFSPMFNGDEPNIALHRGSMAEVEGMSHEIEGSFNPMTGNDPYAQRNAAEEALTLLANQQSKQEIVGAFNPLLIRDGEAPDDQYFDNEENDVFAAMKKGLFIAKASEPTIRTDKSETERNAGEMGYLDVQGYMDIAG